MTIDKNRPLWIPRFLLLPILLLSLSALAQKAENEEKPAAGEGVQLGTEYTDRGADTCIKCHDETSEFPVFSIFKTKHARPADKRTPFAGLQCETCHGPGGEHGKRVRPGQKRPPIINFGAKSVVSVERQNEICLGCHQSDARIGWKGSTHEQVEVACASCHKIHAVHDRVLTKQQQPEVCYQCHKKARADFFKPSVHPVRFGVMACSECHSTHGAVSASLLARPTLNQTCYTCHAEKRGPFLWEHAPVAENCTRSIRLCWSSVRPCCASSVTPKPGTRVWRSRAQTCRAGPLRVSSWRAAARIATRRCTDRITHRA